MQKIMGSPCRKSTLLTGSLIFILCSFFSVPYASAAGLKLVDIVHGPAKIKDENENYYYFRVKITTSDKADLIFKRFDCVLTGDDNQLFKECWINIAGWSAGLSVSQQTPIMMRTVQVGLSENESSNFHIWNTSKIGGNKGFLSISLPEKGFAEMYFLWQVPSSFLVKKIKIGDLLEISI